MKKAGLEKTTERKPDWVDELVAWGCRLLHLEKHQKILTQLAKFVIAGVINTVIDWVIYYVLCYPLGINPIIAQLFSFTIATIVSFYINTIWVFDTTKKKTRRRLVTEFFILNAIALGISTVLLYVFVYPLQMNEMLAKILTTTVTMVFNYITRKLTLEDRKQKAKQ